MPYLKPERKRAVDHGEPPVAAGELNYVLTREAIRYLDVNGLSYQTINDVVGALDGAKAEFQRRVVAPYEDTKIASNGDVYPTRHTQESDDTKPDTHT